MEETLSRPPRTIMEVFKMLPETTLAEVINDTLYASPAPSPFHQRILQKKFKAIDHFVEENSLGRFYHLETLSMTGLSRKKFIRSSGSKNIG